MANKSTNVYIRIEPAVKAQAERILAELGLPASTAVNLFYKQVILHRGLPFAVELPQEGGTQVDTNQQATKTEQGELHDGISK